MALVTGIRGRPVLLGVADKAGFPARVIAKTNLGRSLLESEGLRMAGFAAVLHLMAFMPKNNGFVTLADFDDFFRNRNGRFVTLAAIVPGKCFFPLPVVAGKAVFVLAVIRHFYIAGPFFGHKQ